MGPPAKVYIPVEMRKRIEVLRNYGGSAGIAFNDYVLALLDVALDTYEAAAEALAWDENVKVVPDPTLDEGVVTIQDHRTGKTYTVMLTEDEAGNTIATKDDGTVLKIQIDPKTGDPILVPTDL